MPKMSQEEMRGAARAAAQYAYVPGQAEKKESLTRKAKMAIMGNSYKTAATRRALKKKRQLDDKYQTSRTKAMSSELRRSGLSESEIRQLRGN